MSAHDRVQEIVATALADAQVVLDDVDVSAAGKRKLVRVTLDRRPETDPDGWAVAPTPAMSLDDIAEHSRQISDALDHNEPFGGAAYLLEVSSPGVGRRLREPRHYQRNVGRLLAVTTGGDDVTGRVVRAGSERVVLSVGDPAGERDLAYADIQRAGVVVEFTSTQERDE